MNQPFPVLELVKEALESILGAKLGCSAWSEKVAFILPDTLSIYLNMFLIYVSEWLVALFSYEILLFIIWFRPATLLKRDSNTGVFLWIMQNF